MKTKQVTINVVRNYFKSATVVVDVPADMSDADLREFVGVDEHIQSSIDEQLGQGSLQGGEDEVNIEDEFSERNLLLAACKKVENDPELNEQFRKQFGSDWTWTYAAIEANDLDGIKKSARKLIMKLAASK